MKKIIITLVIVAVAGLTVYFVYDWFASSLQRNPNFASGNGRIEATEINIAAKIAGKVEKICVLEGDKVTGGQVLVVMQTNTLIAYLAQAEAKREQAIAADVSAKAKIDFQIASLEKAKTELARYQVLEENQRIRYKRYKNLLAKDATSREHFETAETSWLTAKKNVISAQAAIKETEANLAMAKADALGAKANIYAAEADIARIKADIDDSILKAPLAGRIQYRVAEPGEVLSAGGRALNMVDLTDVYITFFLPEETAGKVKIGSDVRIVLDALPEYPLPAKVTYVADVAQFTPKTVETHVERQKLMFRVKAHINRELLELCIDMIKTGLPGVAWVRLNDQVDWPKKLQINPKARELALKRRQQIQESGKTVSDVLQSETKVQAKKMPKNANSFKKAIKGATKEQAIDVEVKAAKQFNELNRTAVEKSITAAKKHEQARAAEVNKTVEKAKEKNAAAQKAVIKKGDAK